MLPGKIAQSLITLAILTLELHVRRWPRPTEHIDEVPEVIALIKRSVTVFLQELVRIEVLACGLASCHQEDMVAPETSWVREDQDAVNHHRKCSLSSPVTLYCIRESCIISIHPDEEVGKRCSKKEPGQECPGHDEDKELAVVSAANAIVEPDAVVVLRLDASVAYPTVVRSGWSPDLTGLAEFDRHLHGCSRSVRGFLLPGLYHDPRGSGRADGQRIVVRSIFGMRMIISR